MEIGDFIALVNKAFDKQLEEYAWQFWLVKYPSMNEETFISFSDFLDQIKTGETAEQGVFIDQVGF